MFGDDVAKLVVLIGADIRHLETGLTRAEARVNKFAKSGSVMGGALAAGAKTAAIAVGVLSAAFVGMGIKFNAAMEQSQIMFSTMIGDAQRAEVFFDDLKEMSIKTPFDVSVLADAAKRMLAYGIPVDEIQRDIKAIGDAIASLGGGNVSIERVTVALGQMMAKGKLQSQEMRQLAEAGIPAWKYLAEFLKTDVEGAMMLVEERAVDGAEAVKAIVAGMEGQFGGGMEVLTKTMEGSWGVIKNLSKQIAGELTEPIFESIRDQMVKLATETLPDVLNKIRAQKEFEEEVELRYMTGAPIPASASEEERKREEAMRASMHWQAVSGYPGAELPYPVQTDLYNREYDKILERIAQLYKDIEGEREVNDALSPIRTAGSYEQIGILEKQLVDIEGRLESIRRLASGETVLPMMMKDGDVTNLTIAEEKTREMVAHAIKLHGKDMSDTEGWGAGGFIGPTVGPAIAAAAGIAYNLEQDRIRDLAEKRIKEEQRINDQIEDYHRDRLAAMLKREVLYRDKVQDAIEATRDAVRSSVEDILTSPTEVTAFDLFKSTDKGEGLFGGYMDKWDEQARRMRDAMNNPNSPWRNMIPENILSAGPEATKFYGEDWLDKFYSGQMMGEIDWDAFIRQYNEAKTREDGRNAMIEHGAALIGVSPEAVRKTLGLQNGEDMANDIITTLGDTWMEKKPGVMLLNQLNDDLNSNKGMLEGMGEGIWEILLGAIEKSDISVLESLAGSISPLLVEWLRANGYLHALGEP
jgi:tape measure domain-containing protein